MFWQKESVAICRPYDVAVGTLDHNNLGVVEFESLNPK
jgi:glycyl-tRNA synthetase alpha subunit